MSNAIVHDYFSNADALSLSELVKYISAELKVLKNA